MKARIKRIVARGNAYFALNWRVMPYQPILFLFLFLGALLAVTLSVEYPSFDDATVFWRWIGLSMVSPPMAFAAWVMVRWHPGRARYVGLWFRLGADLGQLVSLSAFLTVISRDIDMLAAELYAYEIFAATWWFVLVLVVRDSWKLFITERVANALEDRVGDVT